MTFVHYNNDYYNFAVSPIVLYRMVYMYIHFSYTVWFAHWEYNFFFPISYAHNVVTHSILRDQIFSIGMYSEAIKKFDFLHITLTLIKLIRIFHHTYRKTIELWLMRISLYNVMNCIFMYWFTEFLDLLVLWPDCTSNGQWKKKKIHSVCY